MPKKILLIITGSVASYKAMDLLRLLTKNSYQVTCVLTKAACEFITPLLASSLSGNTTYHDLFAAEEGSEMSHIKLSRQSDLIIIAPASADFIAKIANGYADDLASSLVLAANKKIILAPAMNQEMWHKKSTQENLTKAIQSGISLLEPESDVLACGEMGIGKMPSPNKIFEKISDFFANQNQLQGKKIVITGGATFEPIDPVRFIGNRSSGNQAIAIVKILEEMGAEVTLIAANIHQSIPISEKKIIKVKTAEEMLNAVKKHIAKTHVFIGCAAVADFKVKNFSSEKIKKSAVKNLTLRLEKNPDILEFVGTGKKRPQLVIGFAAESENLQKYAQEKLRKKNCDFIIANDLAGGEIFGSQETEAYLVGKQKIKDLGKISKEHLAKILAGEIVRFLADVLPKKSL